MLTSAQISKASSIPNDLGFIVRRDQTLVKVENTARRPQMIRAACAGACWPPLLSKSGTCPSGGAMAGPSGSIMKLGEAVGTGNKMHVCALRAKEGEDAVPPDVVVIRLNHGHQWNKETGRK